MQRKQLSSSDFHSRGRPSSSSSHERGGGGTGKSSHKSRWILWVLPVTIIVLYYILPHRVLVKDYQAAADFRVGLENYKSQPRTPSLRRGGPSGHNITGLANHQNVRAIDLLAQHLPHAVGNIPRPVDSPSGKPHVVYRVLCCGLGHRLGRNAMAFKYAAEVKYGAPTRNQYTTLIFLCS